MSDPNAGVMMRWVLSIGWLTGCPAELSRSQGWNGWTDTELAGTTPAPLQHLLSICPHHTHTGGRSHSSVSTYSAQFGRLSVSYSASNWPPKSNIFHSVAAVKYEVWRLLFFVLSFYTQHFHATVWISLSHALLFTTLTISPVCVGWHKLLFSHSWSFFSWLDTDKKNCVYFY